MIIDSLLLESRIGRLEKQFNELEKDGFLTPKEVASLLSVSLSTSYNLFKEPSFPGKKIAGTFRVRKSQLYKYFDNLPKH